MSTFEAAIAETARILNIDPKSLSDAQRAALGLIRASAEISRRLTGSRHATVQTLDWIKLVDYSATSILAEHLIQQASGEAPTWFAGQPAAVAEALPLPLLALGLLTVIPPEQHHHGEAWEYVDAALVQVGFPALTVAPLRGWLRGEASADVNAQTETQLEQLAAHNEVCAAVFNGARAWRALNMEQAPKSKFNSVFHKARECIRANLEALALDADAFGIDRARVRRLAQRLENDHFRLGILGEFKRGKSTLINAFVGRPGVLPADILPCTSALTELRFGESERYELRRTEPPFEYVPSDEIAFRESAGNAALQQAMAAERSPGAIEKHGS